MLKQFLLFSFSLASLSAVAQVPYTTVPDTAEMKRIRDKKIKCEYDIRVPFDSVTGNLTKGAKPDTTYSVYDRMGREIDFSYPDDEGKREHNYVWYNEKGQAVREFSCNADSTEGFVDYWTYNDKGQVVLEISCERTGKKEEPFNWTEFQYDNSGNLVFDRVYSLNPDGSKDYGTYQRYSYSAGYTIKTGFRENGDTSYIDSTREDANGNYWSVRWHYKKIKPGKYSRVLVAKSVSNVENLGSRKRTSVCMQYFDYDNGKLEEEFIDTTISDRNGNILEARDPYGYEKFFWDERGNLEYSIKYNRANQPLIRRTEVFIFYE